MMRRSRRNPKQVKICPLPHACVDRYSGAEVHTDCWCSMLDSLACVANVCIVATGVVAWGDAHRGVHPSSQGRSVGFMPRMWLQDKKAGCSCWLVMCSA